jgi:glutamate dehydrogenase
LQSRCTKLVAAFNHAHIFLDPDPDPEASYRERERLFRQPRSSWREYDASVLSKGGGVFDRSAKAIPLSLEVRRLLDVDGESASGEEVIRRVLTMRVDLLYNGGIGTYVKASTEDDAEVGDRANDRVRVDGREVRARVVAEGGNLGFTQRGRLEYWTRGGSINTDAIDNSGGVDMSDHEVNIKILMDLLVKRRVVKGRDERNRILGEMTEEVATLVLADNESQARALTLDGLRSVARYEEFVRLIEDMVGAGELNRADDQIPTRDELLARPERKLGLPRPLLCLLLGHMKMWAFQMVMETEFPDSDAGKPFLNLYFPQRLQGFAEHFEAHALRREIIATAAVNYVINNAGIAFLQRLMSATKAEIGDVMAAYLEADSKCNGRERRAAALAAGQPAADEQAALLALEESLETAVRGTLGSPAS